MPRKPTARQQSQAVTAAIQAFLRLPVRTRWVLGGLAVLGVAAFLMVSHQQRQADRGSQVVADGENEFAFCFWNVENLFDDKDDKRREVDEEYDNPFAENQKLRELKYDRIASALVKMNGGKGPDVIACCEVESVRAAEILMGVLNAKLKEAKKDEKLLYKTVAMQNLDAGRHIAPCVISRVNVDVRGTRLVKKPLRILEAHLYVNGADLCVLASHWTSQLKQRDGGDGDSGREKYADALYERFRELNKKSVDTDVLICGDFNDTPDADPVRRNLGATADKSKVKPTSDPNNEPFLLNLMGGKDPTKFGTLWYSGKPLIYDQIVVSPGMLDAKGWSVDPDSVATVTDGLTRFGSTRREPWRFGDPGKEVRDADRGYADHFPVAVKLKVQPVKK
jgi:endonuclease/exonuclease/phosphatase family metal-dependent hydrolase